MNAFKDKKFTLKHIIIFAIVASAATFGITTFWKDYQFTEKSNAAINSYTCNYNVKRMNGFKYIKPLMFVDEDCESEGLMSVKQDITSVVDRYKTMGAINTASVYLRVYQNNQWICVNENEQFDPGSLFKVPVMIAILKQSELAPGFLNKKIAYNQPIDAGKNVAFNAKMIQLGQSYTIKELLTYMIKYSDNNATILLEKNMEPKILQKLFSDFGLSVPNMYATQYLFTAKDYSYFMRAIYNAAYLSSEDSEFAGSLLAQAIFKEGILQGLPPNTKVAHKFGESGNQTVKQLHESAIVYLDNQPYLLTVMTKGSDNKKMSEFIGEVSRTVYNDLKKSN